MQQQLASRRPSDVVSRGRGPWRRRSAITTTRACLRCATAERRRGPSPPPPHRRFLIAAAPPPCPAAPTTAEGTTPPILRTMATGPPGRGAPSFSSSLDDDKDKDTIKKGGEEEEEEEEEDGGRDDPALDPGARAALAVLRFYRQGVSPLLQPACRFQPTCSRYAIAAYRQHGGWRGTVLTAWRLLRCAPWGQGGYDPVAWPPRGLEAVFRHDGAAPVAVVLGAGVMVRLAHALLFE